MSETRPKEIHHANDMTPEYRHISSS